MSLSKVRFYSPWMQEATAGHVPFEDLGLDAARMRRWHPLNRELCLGGRCHLPGLLLNAKGDRVAMNNSVETRYPFLDEEVVAFLAQAQSRLEAARPSARKLLLRSLAERWLPHEVAWRRKGMFRAPFDSFHIEPAPAFVDQLLSPESLRQHRLFRPGSGDALAPGLPASARRQSLQRTSVELGLVAVTSTQLWHQTFIDPSLADVPSSEGRVARGEWASESAERRGVLDKRGGRSSTHPLVHSSTLKEVAAMSYSLSTLWYERSRYLPGVLAVAFSAAADRVAMRPVAGSVLDYVDAD